ncbi:MAG: CYCXC family (seleno)protein [Acidobacteriaceae bacterium]
MRRVFWSLVVAVLVVAGYAIPGNTVHAQFTNPAQDVPAYHAQPPAAGQALPPILSGNQLTGPFFGKKWQVAVYKEAAQIPRVLYQLPCYCRCDRELGHTSLHSCFEGTHAAICETCAMEGAYAYRMTKLGKTPRQIRQGIEHGDYQSIDLDALGRS